MSVVEETLAKLGARTYIDEYIKNNNLNANNIDEFISHARHDFSGSNLWDIRGSQGIQFVTAERGADGFRIVDKYTWDEFRDYVINKDFDQIKFW